MLQRRAPVRVAQDAVLCRKRAVRRPHERVLAARTAPLVPLHPAARPPEPPSVPSPDPSRGLMPPCLAASVVLEPRPPYVVGVGNKPCNRYS